MSRSIKKLIIPLLVVSVLLCSCGTNSFGAMTKSKYERTYVSYFDTVTQLTVYTDSKEKFEEYAEFFNQNMLEYHKLFDIYNDYDVANIKTVNDNAGIKPIKVDKKIIDLIDYAKQQYKKTNGKVNIALGPVLSIWHDYRTKGIDNPDDAKIPTTEELQDANKLTNIDDVVIDRKNSTVFLNKNCMRLDVGAVAKGYAVQEVANECKAKFTGITSALIDVGGNIVAIGKKNDKAEWGLGIRNPKDTNKIIKTVSLEDKSVVTSGDYERVYTVDGRKLHHIIDPDTLYPADYFSSVTIICDGTNSADADVLSTALFNMSLEDGKELLKKYDGAKAIWVDKDNIVIE